MRGTERVRDKIPFDLWDRENGREILFFFSVLRRLKKNEDGSNPGGGDGTAGLGSQVTGADMFSDEKGKLGRGPEKCEGWGGDWPGAAGEKAYAHIPPAVTEVRLGEMDFDMLHCS